MCNVFSGQDEVIKCCDCGIDFMFTAKDQEFYNSKGFKDPPKRCKACRAKKKGLSVEIPENKPEPNVVYSDHVRVKDWDLGEKKPKRNREDHRRQKYQNWRDYESED
jgi:hypothetical protein